MIENELLHIPLDNINIAEGRNRQDFDSGALENLRGSIVERGLIHPIVVSKTGDNGIFLLVAGERRLRCYKELFKQALEIKMDEERYAKIPAQLFDNLDKASQRALELEENIHRENLTWQEEVMAITEFFTIRQAQEREWEDDAEFEYTQAMLGGELHYSQSHISRIFKIARRIQDGDTDILESDSLGSAVASLQRRLHRAIEIETLTFGEAENTAVPPVIDLSELDLGAKPETPAAYPFHVIEGSFREFLKNASPVAPFNFVHCDFPYGIGLHKSDQASMTRTEVQYEDTEALYWDLCDALVSARNQGILSQSCHIMFWFPMSKYQDTLTYFTHHDFRVDPYPLVWMKSDKSGILPDVTRGPRRIYETAFLMSVGDRKILSPTVNAAHYPSESRTKSHVSLKPEGMLDVFLPMFIDSSSVVLDPTMGSGSALASSLRLGAATVVGLDISSDACSLARASCLRAIRNL